MDWGAERASFRVDEEVEARFKGGKRYYRGRITKARRNGTYDVHYDDGDEECHVESHMMRRLGGSSSSCESSRSSAREARRRAREELSGPAHDDAGAVPAAAKKRKASADDDAAHEATTAPAGAVAGHASRGPKPVQQLELVTRKLLQTWPTIAGAAKGFGLKPGTMSDAIKKGREYGGFAWQFAPAGEAAHRIPSSAAPAAAPVGDSVPQPSVADGSFAEAGEGADAPAGDDGAARMEEMADEATTTAPAGAVAVLASRRGGKPVQQLKIGTQDVLRTWPSQVAAFKELGLSSQIQLSNAVREGREYGGFAWRFAPAGEAASVGYPSSAAPTAATAGDTAPRASIVDGSAAEAGEGADAPAGDDGAGAARTEETPMTCAVHGGPANSAAGQAAQPCYTGRPVRKSTSKRGTWCERGPRHAAAKGFRPQ